MGGRGTSSNISITGFRDGDTPSVIRDNESYDVVKMGQRASSNANYGSLPGSDVKQMLQGYKYNGLFWEKPRSTVIYDIKRRRQLWEEEDQEAY